MTRDRIFEQAIKEALYEFRRYRWTKNTEMTIINREVKKDSLFDFMCAPWLPFAEDLPSVDKLQRLMLKRKVENAIDMVPVAGVGYVEEHNLRTKTKAQ